MKEILNKLGLVDQGEFNYQNKKYKLDKQQFQRIIGTALVGSAFIFTPKPAIAEEQPEPIEQNVVQSTVVPPVEQVINPEPVQGQTSEQVINPEPVQGQTSEQVINPEPVQTQTSEPVMNQEQVQSVQTSEPVINQEPVQSVQAPEPVVNQEQVQTQTPDPVIDQEPVQNTQESSIQNELTDELENTNTEQNNNSNDLLNELNNEKQTEEVSSVENNQTILEQKKTPNQENILAESTETSEIINNNETLDKQENDKQLEVRSITKIEPNTDGSYSAKATSTDINDASEEHMLIIDGNNQIISSNGRNGAVYSVDEAKELIENIKEYAKINNVDIDTSNLKPVLGRIDDEGNEVFDLPNGGTVTVKEDEQGNLKYYVDSPNNIEFYNVETKKIDRKLMTDEEKANINTVKPTEPEPMPTPEPEPTPEPIPTPGPEPTSESEPQPEKGQVQEEVTPTPETPITDVDTASPLGAGIAGAGLAMATGYELTKRQKKIQLFKKYHNLIYKFLEIEIEPDLEQINSYNKISQKLTYDNLKNNTADPETMKEIEEYVTKYYNFEPKEKTL